MSLKKRLGFAKKTRTSDEIDREYTDLAIQVGHKSRVIVQLEQEISQHLNRMVEVTSEAVKLQAEKAKIARSLVPTPSEQTEGGAA